MTATYQLNTEKLEYNYRVLLERDEENAATINQQVGWGMCETVGVCVFGGWGGY